LLCFARLCYAWLHYAALGSAWQCFAMRCWPALCYASLRPLALDLTCLHCVAIIRPSMLSLGLLIYAMLGSDLCSWVSFWYVLLCSALLPCATSHYTRCRVLPNGARPHMLSEHWNFVAMIISTTLCVVLSICSSVRSYALPSLLYHFHTLRCLVLFRNRFRKIHHDDIRIVLYFLAL